MTLNCTGTIQGRTIYLAEDLGIPDGQRVRVTIDEIQNFSEWGKGILQSAGALADCDELDAVFAMIENERKRQ